MTTVILAEFFQEKQICQLHYSMLFMSFGITYFLEAWISLNVYVNFMPLRILTKIIRAINSIVFLRFPEYYE